MKEILQDVNSNFHWVIKLLIFFFFVIFKSFLFLMTLNIYNYF